MKEYIKKNKEAWEEAFAVNKIEYGKHNVKRLKEEKFPFLHKDLVEVISQYDLKDKNFRKEPFIDEFGMSYMVGENYQSKPFINFNYKMSDVINGIVNNDMGMIRLEEYDYDMGGNFEILDGKGFPLSYILVAKKKA